MATGRDQLSRRKGIALLAAVFLTAAISALALSAARENRTTAQVAGNEAAAARAFQAAEAGVTRMALALAREARSAAKTLERNEQPQSGWGQALPGTGPIARDGRPYLWMFRGIEIELRAQSEAGKFDLAVGDASLTAPLLSSLGAAGLGLSPEAAARILSEARRRTGGGPSWRLGWRPMGEITELDRLTEFPSKLRARLAQNATVWARRKWPDPLTAPASVYQVLPLSDEERMEWDALRSGPPPEWRLSGSETLTISAVARLPGGARARAIAVATISASLREPAIQIIARPPVQVGPEGLGAGPD